MARRYRGSVSTFGMARNERVLQSSFHSTWHGQKSAINRVFEKTAFIVRLLGEIAGQAAGLQTQFDWSLAAIARFDFIHGDGTDVAPVVHVLPFALLIVGENHQYL